MFDFRADDVVGKIAPRPLLLMHAANDSVTPTEQSIELFKRAGQPAELHLFSDADHFMFGEGNVRVWDLVRTGSTIISRRRPQRSSAPPRIRRAGLFS